MLTECQIERAWEKLLAAETRSLYFADLAAQYNRVRQIITGVSFFLSSGAAATIIGKGPGWIAASLAVVVAVLSAYSIAASLDRKIATMVKLHCAWNEIASDWDRVWNHTYHEDAERTFDDIVRRERDLSELATTDAPNDQHRLAKWQEQVFRQHHLLEA